MGCFIVPATEAVVTTVATKIIERKEYDDATAELKKVKLTSNLKKLNHMLWGGSGLLAFEHLWHGEIQPFFPFLSAASNPADTVEMLKEMSTVGVAMAVAVTAIWGVMTIVSNAIEKREETSTIEMTEES
ncbi:MAG: hypothetical protein U0K86_05130 [Agathobacter sp.]|nr:hypothetical protein [Agathobacter sp.]